MGIEIDFDNAQSTDRFAGIMMWAKYGDNTLVRCDISYEAISDWFCDRPSREDMKNVVIKHKGLFYRKFAQKISNGQISVVTGNTGQVQRVLLKSGDFNVDFRENT